MNNPYLPCVPIKEQFSETQYNNPWSLLFSLLSLTIILFYSISSTLYPTHLFMQIHFIIEMTLIQKNLSTLLFTNNSRILVSFTHIFIILVLYFHFYPLHYNQSIMYHQSYTLTFITIQTNPFSYWSSSNNQQIKDYQLLPFILHPWPYSSLSLSLSLSMR